MLQDGSKNDEVELAYVVRKLRARRRLDQTKYHRNRSVRRVLSQLRAGNSRDNADYLGLRQHAAKIHGRRAAAAAEIQRPLGCKRLLRHERENTRLEIKRHISGIFVTGDLVADATDALD